MVDFYTPWKHENEYLYLWFSDVLEGIEMERIDLKWVNRIDAVNRMFLNLRVDLFSKHVFTK